VRAPTCSSTATSRSRSTSGGLTIRDLADVDGELVLDTTKPDGTLRKLIEVNKIHSLGWKAQIDLSEGLTLTDRWYR
jgi:GDP-L-fucose synthase